MSGQTRGGTPREEAGERPEEAGPRARQRLLDSVIAHFTAEGLADQSLRRIAEAIGSSHRMLLYHFGSKDGLLVEVVREVEARTQVRLMAFGEDAVGDTDELIRRMWAYLADPSLGDFERLFSPSTAWALQGDESIRLLLKDNIEHWLDAETWRCHPQACPRTSRGRTRGSGWPSRGASYSTCSPREIAPVSRPPSRSSPGATAGGGGTLRTTRAAATAPRRGRGGPGRP